MRQHRRGGPLQVKSNGKSAMDDRADDRARKRESERILRRVARESETIGASNLARQVATTQTEEDRIDRIGTRIGRGLGIVVALGLLIYLYVTYFRH